VGLKRGDLVRWVNDHDIYEAADSGLRGIKPNYRHGIIMEVSKKDPHAVIVCCYDCNKQSHWVILNLSEDEFEVLSGGQLGCVS